MNTVAISGADVRSPKRQIAFKQIHQQPMVTSQAVPLAKQATPAIPQTNVISIVPAPSIGSKPKDMSRTVALASPALADASSSLAAYSMMKTRNAVSFKGTREVDDDEKLTKAERFNRLRNFVVDGFKKTDDKFDETYSRFNILEDRLKEVSEKADRPTEVHHHTTITKPLGMLTRPVEVYGMKMELPSIMHGYGEAEEKLTNQLRTEATRNILGAKKNITPVENPVIHFMTSELSGFYKAGGLAIVPRELIANFVAHIDGARGVGHLPLYTGQIENNAYLKLKKQKDGSFKYVKKIIDPNDSSKDKEITLATIRKSHDMELPIYTDVGKTTEKVGVYETVDDVLQPVSYEETLAQIKNEKVRKEIEKSMEVGKDYETSTIKFTAPKPNRAVIQFANKETDAVDIDLIMNGLTPEKAKEIKEKLDMGCVYELPVSEFIEKDGNQLEAFDDDLAGKLSKDIINEKKAVIRFMPEEPPKAEAKFKLKFYENDKLSLAGPKTAGLDKNMYDNKTFNAGETERFVYFNKFVYENLFNSEEYMADPEPVDMIVGNDWHTGPLSAMIRLLTPARAAHGEIDPRSAEKLQNTPIITIMHNFKLNGSVDHSQAKLLSVMFGEHAAKIVENAHMPYNADLPYECLNGLFHGSSFNPQGQAMSYSDEIVFVSKGNAKEATTIREKGGINYSIASMRARTWQYTEDKLKEIAKATGLDTNEVTFNPTAKGITNGCDRVNNILTKAKARKLEKQLELKEGSLISEEVAKNDPFEAHQHNKEVLLEQRIKVDVEKAKETNGKDNPMRLYDYQHTDLTGVTADTPIIGQAGRIVDQKGIDIYVAGYEALIKSGNYDKNNVPVLWLNGKGDKNFIDKFLEAKTRIREIDPVAADRMICSGNFGEPGRYDAAKTIFDFSAMSSWDEPCGLVHKEIAYFSGAIPIVNKVGGLTDGLYEFKKGADNSKANAFFVDFMDKDTHPYEEAIAHNANAWAGAMADALELYKNREAFGQGIKNSYLARHDWAHGKTQEYADLGKRMGVFEESVDTDYKRFETKTAA